MADVIPPEILIPTLVNRGDYLAIEQGRFIIKPKSGIIPKDNWLKRNKRPIELAIIKRLGISSYCYEYYTAGIYDVGNGKRESGITLHYKNILTGETPRLTYTVPLTRDRTTKNGNKGQRLPGKQFRVSHRMSFYKLWVKLDLPLPVRLSAFHDCMGKLSNVLLTGTCNDGIKLDKENLAMLEISYEEILSSYCCENPIKSPDNYPTTTRQAPDNVPTRTPDKETPQSHTQQSLEPDSTTGTPNHGNKVIRVEGYKGESNIIPIHPREQSNEEWLADNE
jgi:hypothetical protein